MKPILVTKSYRLNRLKLKRADLLLYKQLLEESLRKLRPTNDKNKSGQLEDNNV